MSDEQPGMNELLQALVQVGRIAEAMLNARQAAKQQSAVAAAELDAAAHCGRGRD